MKRFGTFCVTVFLPVILFASADISFPSEKERIALVIGNGQYKSVPLNNPANDANDMAKALKKCGFKVTYRENIGQREMEEAIRKFGKNLQSGGVGLFFFAGHGVQIGGRNYLIPTDATIHEKADVKYEAVDAGRVLDAMEWAENELNIVILDACRDNPYGSDFRSINRGLARMDAPKGTIIAYSTSPGKVAMDGKDGNSPYTKALLKYMDFEDLTLEQVFKKVRKEIYAATNGKQIPWESTSLTGTFYFKNTEPQREPMEVKEAKREPIPKPPKKMLSRKTGILDRAPLYDKYFKALGQSGLPDALLFFEEALKKNPENDEARSGMAIGLIFLGKEEDIDYHLKRLKESNSFSANVRVAVGFMEGLQGLYMEGFYELKRALEDGGNRALIRLCTASVAERNGDQQQAKKALEEYRSLVPTHERNAFYAQLAKRVDIRAKLLGGYYITYPKVPDQYAFGIDFSIIDGSLAASLTQNENLQYYELQTVSFDNGKLVFSVKEAVNRLWTLNEYEAEPKENFDKIPVQIRQVEGNCGKNGVTGQALMVRAPESKHQSRSIQFYPTGIPLAHSRGCFVATAAFGSPFDEQVNTLRTFRDQIMLKSAIGKRFTDLYYRYGPILAKIIEKRSWARAATRIALMPVVILAGTALGHPEDCTTVFLIFVFGLLGGCLFWKNRKSKSL